MRIQDDESLFLGLGDVYDLVPALKIRKIEERSADGSSALGLRARGSVIGYNTVAGMKNQ